jgi:hypothetical protein
MIRYRKSLAEILNDPIIQARFRHGQRTGDFSFWLDSVRTLASGRFLAPPPAAALRVTAHMFEVAGRCRNGEMGVVPTSPSEIVDETFRAAYIPPTQQNSMDSRAGKPLRYPELGRSPAMDATIRLQWEMPHIGKLPDNPH